MFRQKDSQGREGDFPNLSGSLQQISLAPASLPEGCWFLSSRGHISRHIKMQNTQLFLSNSVLLHRLHWRSSLCQECKSRLGSGGGKAACASQVPELFSMYSVLSAVMQQGWHSSLLHKGQCASSLGLLSWRAVCLLYQASAVLLVSSLQFIWCGQVCFQRALRLFFFKALSQRNSQISEYNLLRKAHCLSQSNIQNIGWLPYSILWQKLIGFSLGGYRLDVIWSRQDWPSFKTCETVAHIICLPKINYVCGPMTCQWLGGICSYS